VAKVGASRVTLLRPSKICLNSIKGVNEMKKFRVIATQLHYFALEVEAENAEQAKIAAIYTELKDFKPMGEIGDFKINTIGEINE